MSETPSQPPQSPESPAKRAPLGMFLGSFIVVLILQFFVLLPGLGRYTALIFNAKFSFAGIIDALILIRFLIGWKRREHGDWWIFYWILIITSPLWMEVTANLFLNRSL